MHEFAGGLQLGLAFETRLQPVLHRLHVVVGGLLDVLDGLRVGLRKIRHQSPKVTARGFRQGLEFGESGIGQGDEPLHLHLHAAVHEAVFRQQRPQRRHLRGVAAVQRRQGGECGGGHGAALGGAVGQVMAVGSEVIRIEVEGAGNLKQNEPPALVNTTQDATKIGVIAATSAQLSLAQESDWYAEYLAPVISIKVVPGLDEAIAHINRYSSHHTDAILTRDHMHAQRFLREVDSASVMVNTSTRFADGFEYGLGAEIGISTDKFHARGPVGIEGLTSLKYVVLGDGEVRI